MKTSKKILYRSIKSKYKIGRMFALALMATTFWFANQMAAIVFADSLPQYLNYILPYVAIGGAVIVVLLVDYKLYDGAIEAFTAYRIDGWRKLSSAGKSMIIAVGLRYAISVALTIGAVYFAADEAASPIQDKSEQAAAQVNSASAQVRKEIAATRADYMKKADAVVEDAKQQAEKLENDAIESRGKNWAKSYRQNSAYIMTSDRRDIRNFREDVKRAKQRGNVLIADANRKYDRLMEQMEAQIAAIQQTGQTSIDVSTNSYNTASDKVKAVKAATSGFGWVLDILFALMTLIHVAAVSDYAKDQDDPERALDELMGRDEASFSDVVASGFKAIWDMIVSLSAVVASWFSVRSSSMMEVATSRIEQASISKHRASQAWRKAKMAGYDNTKTTGGNDEQQQDNTKTTPKKSEQQAAHSSEKKQQQPAASPTPEPEKPANTGGQQQDNSRTTVDNGQRTTDNTSTTDNEQHQDNRQRSAAAREARKKLNRRKNAHKSKAKKYLEKARAAELIEDRERYSELAKNQIEAAKAIELEITNLSTYE
jgi:hypothetical protein